MSRWCVLPLIALIVLILASACSWAAPTPGIAPEPTGVLALPSVAISRPPTVTPRPLPTRTSAPPAVTLPPVQPKLGDILVRPTDGMEMVYVPGGSFLMGSTLAQVQHALLECQQYPDPYGKCSLAAFEVESPQHRVTLGGYWLDRTEVTNAQYARCVAGGACRRSRLAGDPAYGDDGYPVAGVPWQDAAGYCMWAGASLPTEAQWEYGARGKDGHVYPWGDEFDCSRGNFWDPTSGCDDGYARPAPVGSFRQGASWSGALDMAGNVWEWVLDGYSTYSAADQVDPTGPSSASDRILRGGSWGYHQPFVRSAYRYAVPAAADYLAVGFRCAMPARVTD